MSLNRRSFLQLLGSTIVTATLPTEQEDAVDSEIPQLSRLDGHIASAFLRTEPLSDDEKRRAFGDALYAGGLFTKLDGSQPVTFKAGWDGENWAEL